VMIPAMNDDNNDNRERKVSREERTQKKN
jgi:hypothetical protein